MQDLAAILIYGNERHVRPWGFGGRNSLFLSADHSGPTHIRLTALARITEGEKASRKGSFTIEFPANYSSPDSTPGSFQCLPLCFSQNLHPISVPGSVLGTGDTDLIQTQLLPSKEPLS